MAASGPAHGIARYTREMVARVRQSEEWDLTLLVQNQHLTEAATHFPGLRLVGTRFGPFHPGEILELPYLIWKLRPTLVHFTSLAVSFCPGCPYVVSVHDLIPQVCYPSQAKQLHWRFYLAPLLRRASAIFCGSQHTLFDLQRLAGPQLKSKARVTYYGVETLSDPNKTHSSDSNPQTARPDPTGVVGPLQRPYILTVTNPKPHKNAEFLLRAFAKVDLPLDLVLVCKNSSAIDSLVSQDCRIHRIDSVSDQALSQLMGSAWAVCMPSLYEGFGLPPLEGMSMGIPAIVARAASLPEVVGPDTPTFDPHNEQDFVNSLTQLWNDPDTYRLLQQQAPQQAARFTWENVAQIHREVYRQLCSPSLPKS